MLITLQSLDQFLLELVNLSYHNVLLDNLALMISYMGVIYFWIIISVLLYFFGDVKGKNVAKKMIIMLVMVFLITQLFKIIIMRPRPYSELSALIVLATENDFSFPSGHTALSAAMSYVLSVEYNNYFFMIIPIIVAFTRLYIGVHYPSDLVGGFIIGVLCVNLGYKYKIFEKLNLIFN